MKTAQVDATNFGNCLGCTKPMHGVQKVVLFRHPETEVLAALCTDCYLNGKIGDLERQGYIEMR